MHEVCEGGICVPQTPVLSIPYGSAITGSGVGIGIDSHDNVYVVGSVSGPADFGNGTIYGIGTRDTFLVSYTPAGALRWVKRFGGSSITAATGIAIDSNDQIVIVGDMLSNVDFGGGSLSLTLAPSEIFVAGFDADGNYRFATNYTVNADWIDVAFDASGSIHLAATFNGTGVIGNDTLVSAGAQDVLVAALGPMGAPTWAKRLGGAATDKTRGLAAAPNGTVYIAGDFASSPVDLGNGPLTPGGSADSFLAGFSSAGQYQWAKVAGETIIQNAERVALDPAGNVYVSGMHGGGNDFVPGSTASNAENVFLRSYDTTGAKRWSWTLPSTGPATEAFVTTSKDGKVYTAGDYEGTLDAGFGPMSATQEDIFLASYDNDGTPRFAVHFGGAHGDFAIAVAVDSVGRCYMTGNYTGTPNYGDGPHPNSPTGGYYLLRYVP